jgi:non-homologous end joining protein Ku
MKALWKGNISFALVNIPVKLYGATHKRDRAGSTMKCNTLGSGKGKVNT